MYLIYNPFNSSHLSCEEQVKGGISLQQNRILNIFRLVLNDFYQMYSTVLSVCVLNFTQARALYNYCDNNMLVLFLIHLSIT